MSRLELKVPPDVVALVVLGVMWLAASVSPSLVAPFAALTVVALVLFAVGVWLIVAARIAFSRHETTFSPVAPGGARELVTHGPYRFSRNPMYAGTLLILLSAAVLLGNPLSAVVAFAYAAYVGRFQIRPEERVMRERFGQAYDAYAVRVRRWV